MAYQVLARKWRPKIFDELIGQSHISQTLLNAIRSDRIPHAILLTGPRGTGKTSTARILAKSLRCLKATDFTPCNTCSECEDIGNSRSIDVIEIDGASNNGVDAIRELRNTVGFMPASGKFKIYIIDEVHMLSGSAFNALLKTLEEPPAHVLFIMATTEVQKIPSTILSRCQRFGFRKISTRLIADHLSEICRQEKVTIEPAAAWALARQADGSMRDSQSLLDQVISFCEGNLSLKKVTAALGLTDRGILAKAILALVTRDTQLTVNVVESLFSVGHDPIVFMKDLLEELRHLILIKVAPEKAATVIDLPTEEITQLTEISKSLGQEDIHLLFDMALKGAQDLYRSPEQRITLEMILLRMSIAPRVQNLMHLANPTFAPSTKTTSAPVPTPAINLTPTPTSGDAATISTSAPTSTSTRDAATTTQPDRLNERWSDFVDRVRKVNGLIAAKLDQLHLLEQKGQSLTLGVPEKYKFLYTQTADAGFQKKLVNYLNTFWGPGHEVTVQMHNENNPMATTPTMSPAKLQEKKQEDDNDALLKKIEEHPLVKKTKSIFNTQIKSIREN